MFLLFHAKWISFQNKSFWFIIPSGVSNHVNQLPCTSNFDENNFLRLGFGHCGKSSEECKDELLPYMLPNQPSIVRAAAAIALGMIFIGTKDDDIMTHLVFEVDDVFVDHT